jgi:hypothetical protein
MPSRSYATGSTGQATRTCRDRPTAARGIATANTARSSADIATTRTAGGPRLAPRGDHAANSIRSSRARGSRAAPAAARAAATTGIGATAGRRLGASGGGTCLPDPGIPIRVDLEIVGPDDLTTAGSQEHGGDPASSCSSAHHPKPHSARRSLRRPPRRAESRV